MANKVHKNDQQHVFGRISKESVHCDEMMLVNSFGKYSVTAYINCSHIISLHWTRTQWPIGSQMWLVNKESTYKGRRHEFMDNGLQKKKKRKPRLQMTESGHPEERLASYKDEESVQARGTLHDDDEC